MKKWKRRRAERLLFISRRAPFQAPEWGVGQVVQHDRTMFIVTRWSDSAPSHNARGGAIAQWEVWGRPAGDDELAATMADAAALILAEAGMQGTPPGGGGAAEADGGPTALPPDEE